jgi:hypothetical protein
MNAWKILLDMQTHELTNCSRQPLVHLPTQVQCQKAAKHVAADGISFWCKTWRVSKSDFTLRKTRPPPPQFLELESGLFPKETGVGDQTLLSVRGVRPANRRPLPATAGE